MISDSASSAVSAHADPTQLPDLTHVRPVAGLSQAFLLDVQLLPVLHDEEGLLSFYVSPASRLYGLDVLRQMLGRKGLIKKVDSSSWLMEQIERLYEADPPDYLSVAGDDADLDDDLAALKLLAEDAPVVRFVQNQISTAIATGASDIHFEVFDDHFRVRHRIDGMLIERERLPRAMYLPTISHLKIRGHMNIAERRLPQDGRARFDLQDRTVDLRVSTVPTVHGESMVIRILDQGPGVLELAALGLDPRGAELFSQAINQPHGMILVTGPTGSGKTTTLYAVLKELNNQQNKIITVEDPVEYQMAGINQIHVRANIGLTFPAALRSIVRQDPDVILVGEIRDAETAEIAIQSALTGHLVLSTLHTNDSFGASHRLMDMGIEGYLIASSVVMVVAQRLVRVICSSCKHEKPAMSSDLEVIHQLYPNCSESVRLWHGLGCSACAHTGYRGRAGIYEFLPFTNRVKEAVLRKESAESLRRVAVAEGVTTMQQNGIHMVLSGQTTLDELLRVTQRESA